MTSYGAYNAGLRCKNRNCNSFGKPHPNCKCYGEMAEGGEASFCGESRAHENGCQYFQDGGEVIPDDAVTIDPPTEIPDDAVTIDQPEPSQEAVVSEPEIPDDAVTIDAQQEIPDDAVTIDVPTTKDWSQGSGKITPEMRDQLNKDYEDAFEVGSVVTGGGVVGAAGRAANAAAKYANLSKVGSAILKGALENGLIEGADEASRKMLGEDQEHPVASILAASGIGAVFHGLGSKIGSVASDKLKTIKETKLGNAAASFVAGLGSAANKGSAEGRSKIQHAVGSELFDEKAYEAGRKYFETIIGAPQKAASTIGAYEGARRGYHEDGITGALEEGSKGALKGFALGKALGLGTKVATPVVIKLLSSGTTKGMLDALNHFEQYSNGVGHVDKAIESLFGGAAKAGTLGVDKLQSGKTRQELEDWIDGGGVTSDVHDESQTPEETPAFAEGGEVKSVHKGENGIAIHFPAQNMVMQAAKARASNYLSSLRPPKHPPKLAFDDAPDDRQKKKAYHRALDIAINPLSVLDKIKSGMVEPEHIKHLGAMFPEVVTLLQQKATERISRDQLDGKKPNYKVRQGLSMLLGTPLSAELTPQSIQAAQEVFAKAKQQSHPNQTESPKKNTSKLSKSDQAYLTDDQARQRRQQRES